MCGSSASWCARTDRIFDVKGMYVLDAAVLDGRRVHRVHDVPCFGRKARLRAQPYRPHLPHPRAYWEYGITQAEVVRPPTNPPDGELDTSGVQATVGVKQLAIDPVPVI